MILHSEVLKENNININDNTQNLKILDGLNNNEKSKNNLIIAYNFDENEIDMKGDKYLENKYKKMLKEKNEFIEALKRENSTLKKENKKSAEFQKNNNQINVGNYNKKEIENVISQLHEKNVEKIFEKCDKLETLLNKLEDTLQKINTNTSILVEVINRNNKIVINENKSNENKNNARTINAKNSKENINNKSIFNENEINENIFNENKNNKNIIGSDINIKNITDGNVIIKNTTNENKINEKNDFIIIYDNDKNIFNEIKLIKQDLKNSELQTIFFNEDGTINLKAFDSNFYQEKIKKILNELKNFLIDPAEYFPMFKFYYLDPIINNTEIKSDEKEILNEKIELVWQEISNIICNQK